MHDRGQDPEPVPFEGRPPRQEREQDPRQAVEVGPLVDGAPGRLLGGHVAGSAEQLPALGQGGSAQEPRQPEVHQARLVAVVEEHVERLEVAVQDPLGVGVREPLAELARQLQGVLRLPGLALDPSLEGAAREEVHDHVGDRPRDPRGVHPDHVGVIELTQGEGLAREALQLFAARVAQLGEDRLEGKGHPARLVHDLVDRAHSAPRELTHDPIGAEVVGDPEARERRLMGRRLRLVDEREGGVDVLGRGLPALAQEERQAQARIALASLADFFQARLKRAQVDAPQAMERARQRSVESVVRSDHPLRIAAPLAPVPRGAIPAGEPRAPLPTARRRPRPPDPKTRLGGPSLTLTRASPNSETYTAAMSPLLRALKGSPSGHALAEALLDLGTYAVASAEEAESVCRALGTLDQSAPCGVALPSESEDCPATALYMLASLFQRVEDPAAYEVFSTRGLPLLRVAYERRIGAAARHREDLLFLLKVFAMYPDPAGLHLIVSAAQHGLWAEDTLWQTVFSLFDHEHPLARDLVLSLREPLPHGFIAVALLDCANALCLRGLELPHPFGSERGLTLLEEYLTDNDPRWFSYAHSAAAALPFVTSEARSRLLALALDHACPRVQLEAAWASTKLGSKSGLKVLQRACLDPRRAGIARAYLEELQLVDEIPEAALEPDVLAQAEMCSWLAHPHEFGQAPDEIEIVDTRRMYWPPTQDVRQVWTMRFRYPESLAEDGRPAEGLGMVGSITYALYGEAPVTRAPEDLYALHCCWELQINRDPRAPAERSVEAGRALFDQS